MANWPSIANPSRGFEEECYLPQVRVEFEANYVETRAKATRSRSKWPLVWNQMSETDYQLLLAFFIANQGSTFTWTHPVSSVSYTCIFSTDSLKGKVGDNPSTRKEVSCPIEQV